MREVPRPASEVGTIRATTRRVLGLFSGSTGKLPLIDQFAEAEAGRDEKLALDALPLHRNSGRRWLQPLIPYPFFPWERRELRQLGARLRKRIDEINSGDY